MINAAMDELESGDLKLRTASSFYETEPIGFRDQGWFLNRVAEYETSLFPKQLLHRLQLVERELGRKRTIVNGPRSIDIDLLLFANAVMETRDLTLPHPRYRERRFVLEPLMEVNGRLSDPVTGQPVREMLQSVMDQKVKLWKRQ